MNAPSLSRSTHARGLFALVATSLIGLAGAARAATLDDALAAARPGEWSSYDVPLVEGQRSPCCFDWDDGHARASRCKLESRNWNSGTSDDLPLTSDTLRVYLRHAAQGIDRVRALGADCPVDRGALTVHALGPVEPRQSLRVLEAALPPLSHDGRSGVYAAIALHAEPAATAQLIRLASPPAKERDRRDASFWLTQTRGLDGFRAVRDLLERETDDDVRRHLVFVISQSREDEAAVELRRLATQHADAEIRGESLFWLAQDKDPEAEALALHAVDHERSREVRKKAIFALSQLPKKRAIPVLRGIVQSERPRELRREALFWLGQIDDDEALAVFDELLGAPR